MKRVSECCGGESGMAEDAGRCPICGEECDYEEVYDCDECEDTGEVPNLVWDDDVKEFREDGMKPCICKNNF